MKQLFLFLYPRYANLYRSVRGWHCRPTQWIAILLFTLTIVSCEKTKETLPPAIYLLTGIDYTPDRAIIPTGGSLHFGIVATGEGENLTNLVIKKMMPDGSSKVVFDSEMNTTGFSVSKTFFQSVEDTTQWVFQVMDKNRQFATTSLPLDQRPERTGYLPGICQVPCLQYIQFPAVAYLLQPPDPCTECG